MGSESRDMRRRGYDRRGEEKRERNRVETRGDERKPEKGISFNS
jgi:hypothetical protein